MQTEIINPETDKSQPQKFFEFIVLAACVCIIAIRAMYAESPHVNALAVQDFFESTYSLVLSGILIFSAGLWLIVSVWGGKFSYRFTGIEPGMILFSAAGLMAIWLCLHRASISLA